MPQFVLYDKEQDRSVELTVARIFIAVAGIMLLMSSFQTNNSIIFIGLWVAGIGLFIASYFANTLLVKYRISTAWQVLVPFSMVVIVTKDLWFIAPVALYIFFSRFVFNKPVSYSFNDDEIIVNKQIYRSVYSWMTFENIILKDGLLTLDKKNNKLQQIEVDDDKASFQETAFNEFCRERLMVHR